MPEVLIVADDLTGAADCALPFATRGFATVVSLDGAGREDADVLAVDAATRGGSEAEAAERTFRLVARWASSCPSFFKKIDSTLRGHLGAEMAAASAARRLAGGSTLLVVSPAFPDLGRIVRDGRVLVHGVPLGDSDVWLASKAGAPESVLSLLGGAGLHPVLIGLDAVRSGERGLVAFLEKEHPGCDALVCDAETNDDLRTIVAAARGLGHPVMWAGSAGLGCAVAEAEARGRARRHVEPATPVDGPVLVVVGSPSAVAQEQAATLAREPGVGHVALSADGSRWDDASAVITAALATKQDVLVTVDPKGAPTPAGGGTLAAALGRLLAPHAPAVASLVLTGGETARAVLEAVGVRALRLLDEVEPGVPRAIADASPRLPVVTKAGAFGDRETLIRCRTTLRGKRARKVTSASA